MGEPGEDLAHLPHESEPTSPAWTCPHPHPRPKEACSSKETRALDAYSALPLEIWELRSACYSTNLMATHVLPQLSPDIPCQQRFGRVECTPFERLCLL